jgi:hypothetical protein
MELVRWMVGYESIVKLPTKVQKLVGSIVWKAVADWDFITENIYSCQ